MCPHLKVISKHVAECGILQELGLSKIPGPGRSGHPCETCKSQWVDDKPPTSDSITIPMAKLLAYGKKMPLPTVLENITTLTEEGIRWLTSGMRTATEEEKAERIRICKENRCGQYNSETKRCHACGCFVESKAAMATSDCPSKLWPPLKGATPNTNSGCGGCGKV